RTMSEIKITKTMRYDIEYNKELYDILSDIQYAVWRIKNNATSMPWDLQQFSFGYIERFRAWPKEYDLLGKTISLDVYELTKEFSEHVASETVDTATKDAIKKFKNDKPDILAGRKAIAQYRRDGAFPIRVAQIKGLEKETPKKYSVIFSLLSREGAKERGCKTQIPARLRTGAGANDILDRVIDGTYKMCDSEITKRKNKYYLLLTYQFTKEQRYELDESKVMGIDLG